jgi:hypothetical protein
MGAYSGEDRRKYSRLNAAYGVNYKADSEVPYYDFTQTKNVSQGGVSFHTDRIFSVGTPMQLTMRWPFSSEKVDIKAEVVDSRQLANKYSLCETRVRFIDVSKDLFDKIGEFIQQRLKLNEQNIFGY